MINRSTFMISAVAFICVCCGLSFADPATDMQDSKEILKEVQVQHDEIARGGARRAARASRRGYVVPTYNAKPKTATTAKDGQQKEEAVKDEKANAAKQDAAKTEKKDAKDADVKKDDNAGKSDEAKKEEPASPFKDPQAALAFKEFNNFRIRNGLRPCEFSQNLQNIAQWHSNNMYNRRQMYHSGTAGVAENVFMGSSSGVYAVRVWINSPGHRANMLGPYRRVGIARTGGFYTMVLQ